MTGRTAMQRFAWALPPGILVAAAAWCAPLLATTRAARALDGFVAGTWLFLGIWLVWASALAVVTVGLIRGGRSPGPVWTALQAVLVAVLLIGIATPLLSIVGGGPAEALGSAFSFLILPVAVLALSAAQGLVLFLRA